jgi:hypothetical protein
MLVFGIFLFGIVCLVLIKTLFFIIETGIEYNKHIGDG